MVLGFKDRVIIVDGGGKEIAKGTILNVNNYREPSMKYAVEVDGYTEDVLFFGEDELTKDKEDE